MTQAELATGTSMSQRNIAMIETGKFRPRSNFHIQTSQIFHTSFNWTAGGRNPLYDDIGFLQFPPSIFSSKDYSVLKRKTNELMDVIRNILPIFLSESKIPKYSLALSEHGGIYIFHLAESSNIDPILIIKAQDVYVSSVEAAISEADLKKNKEIQISSAVFDNLFDKDKSKSEEALSFLLEQLEIGGIQEKLARHAFITENKYTSITFLVEIKVLAPDGLTEEEAIHEIANMEVTHNSSPGAKRIHLMGNPIRKF